MKKQIADNKDLLLHILKVAADHGSKLSPVQLQKSIFLVGKMFEKELGSEYYKFISHYYGPFSKDIYDDAETMETEGFIAISRSPGQRYSDYSVTALGVERVNSLTDKINGSIVRYVEELIPKILKLSFEQLVSAIYARFPEYSGRSVFRGKV